MNKDFTIGGIDDSDPSNTDTEGTVKLKVSGTGSYSGECSVSFKYMPASGNIGKAGVSGKIGDQVYTGVPIMLDNSLLSGILLMESGGSSSTLEPGRDFVISGYRNNVKKGTAKVILRGIGAYGGTKTLSFKIVQKDVNYKGSLVGGIWK